MKPVTLALTLGDVTGIGPEISAAALAALLPEDDTRYVILGDARAWRIAARRAGMPETLPSWNGSREFVGRLAFAPCGVSLPDDLVPGDARAGDAAVRWVDAAATACRDGILDGMVTAPLSKESVVRAGHAGFTGQTERIAAIAGVDRFGMMLLGQDDRDRWLRVALVTIHLPLREVPSHITGDAVLQAIELASLACRLCDLPRHRIGVCGLNPHAGEGGLLGREEIDVIRPAVERARAEGLYVEGPFAADTLFHRAMVGQFDAVVAQYHDQGLAPLKLVAFDKGVNWTLGLPWPRTSPDHGTAYDIAGKGLASESSMISAIRLARRVARTAVQRSPTSL